jgi:uncharacterized lipoprotein YmbA
MIARRTLLALLPLAACASPDPVLFTLIAVPGTPQPGPRQVIALRRIGLAGYLDRPSIVRSAEDYRLSLAQNERWAEPLADMLGRVLAEDLTRRLPGSTVFQDSGSITVDPQRIVELDVQRFDADASGAVVLAGQAAVREEDARGAGRTQTLRFAVTPRSTATADLVAALSTALGEAADAIAAMLRR